MLNQLTAKIGIGIFLIILSFFLGWKVKGWKDDSQYKEAYVQVMAEIKAQDLVNQKMAQEYQGKISAYQKQVDALNGQVKTEVAEHTVYSECVLPDSGVQLINSAVDTTNKIKSAK